MDTSVVVAIITSLATLVCTVLTVVATSSKTQKQIEVQQAKTDTKLDELTREVREHNNFARRMPVVEEQIKSLSRRVDGIEAK